MAPEVQAPGGKPRFESDIFSLSIVIYEVGSAEWRHKVSQLIERNIPSSRYPHMSNATC